MIKGPNESSTQMLIFDLVWNFCWPGNKWELIAVVEPMHFSSSVSLIETIFNADYRTYNLHVGFFKA
jgi:hypothetical protein